MKSRPILFTSDGLSAICNGYKSMTRCVIDIQPKVTESRLRELNAWVEGETLSNQVNAAWQSGFINEPCPYGNVGEILKIGNLSCSNLVLEIINVRIEQLQEISEQDLDKEGFEGWDDDVTGGGSPWMEFFLYWGSMYANTEFKKESNPWVWVIEFKVVSQ
jgi:hypothetical protein